MYSNYSRLSMEDQLLAAQVAISNALADEEIKERLATLGFGEERLKQALELKTLCETLYQSQKTEYAEQYEATEKLQQEWDKNKITFSMYSTLARVLFRNDPTKMKILGLDKAAAYKISDWIMMARQFYINAMAKQEILEKMKEYTVNEERLQQALEDIKQLEQIKVTQEKEKGEAQQSTSERDDAFARLDEFMHGLINISLAVLYDKPQQVEKLGILALNQKRSPGPAQPQEPAAQEQPLSTTQGSPAAT